MQPEQLQQLIGRRDANAARWDQRTKQGAPHKPFLVLSLCDIFSGGLTASVIPTSGSVLIALAEHFASYWNALIHERRAEMLMPFWALGNSGFWKLNLKSGAQPLHERPGSFSTLSQHYSGAQLHAEVHALLMNPTKREEIRAIVLAQYFDEATAASVARLIRYNDDTDSFRRVLLDAAKNHVQEAQQAINQYSVEHQLPRPVRDQGFRIAVREAYGYRCAACGLRVLTPDGHVLVQGAHIRAWSDNADDRIVNGLSLCHTCHWSFDEGLWSVNPQLIISTSPVLRWNDNIAGYLGQLDQRPLTPPADAAFRPDSDCLHWHREERFRKAL